MPTPTHTRSARLGFGIAPLVLGAALMLGLAAPAAAQDAEALDLSGVEITIGIQSSGSSAATAILEASGVFEDTPYTLTWANFDGANSAVEALFAGAIDGDIGLNFSSPVLTQGNSSEPWTRDDLPFVIIGGNKSLGSNGISIVVHPDSGIETVADLEGKIVSFARGTAQHYFFAIAAREAGLDLDDVEFALMPLAEARAAFVGGAVDALVTAYSNARPVVSAGDGVIIASSAGLFDSYSWLVARPEALEDPLKEAAFADILRRLVLAQEWEEANQEQVVQIYIDVSRQSPEDALANVQDSNSQYVPLDAQAIAANQRQAEVFYEAGVISQQIDTSIVFDDRFNWVLEGGSGEPAGGQ